MNKMDEYFKKHLTDHTEADDGWNIPDEVIWDKALPHLPKKKNKNKIIFFLLSTFLVSAIGFAAYWFSSDLVIENSHSTVSSNSIAKPISPKVIENSSRELQNPITQTSEADPKVNLINATPTRLEHQSVENNITPPALNVQADYQDLTAQAPFLESAISSSLEINNAGPSQSSTDPISSTQLIATRDSFSALVKPEDSERENSMLNSKLQVEPAPLSTNSSKEKNLILDQLSALTQIPVINHKQLLSLEKNQRSSILNRNQFSDGKGLSSVKPQTSFIRREVGIGKAFYGIQLLPALAEAIAGEGDTLDLNLRTNSFNAYYRKFFSEKWSVASGFLYGYADMSAAISVLDTLSCGDLVGFVGDQFVGNVSNREVADCGGGDEPHIMLQLKNDEEVSPGDVLRTVIDAELRVRSLQAPVILTRHWKKRRVEYTMGLGAYFSLLHVDQPVATMDLRRDGESILEEQYEQAAVNKTILDYGSFLDVGMRIKLGSKLNLGLTSRYNFVDIYYTGGEVGLFYRWN